MIEFINFTDGYYDVGQRCEFSPEIEALYVARGSAKYVKPEDDVPVEKKRIPDKENRMMRPEKVIQK